MAALNEISELRKYEIFFETNCEKELLILLSIQKCSEIHNCCIKKDKGNGLTKIPLVF